MLRFSLIVLSLLLVCEARAAIAVLDSLGKRVEVEQPARRIVSLAPHATELLFSAGLGAYVVGVVSYSDYPEAAKALPRVGGYNQIDMEAVLALKPDLIVAWPSGNPDNAIDFLSRQTIPVYLSEPLDFEAIAASVERLAILGGTEKQAARSVASFRHRVAQAQREQSQRPVRRVFYQVWADPLMTASSEHIISRILHLCGGEPVFGKLSKLASSVALEAVLAANPDVILMPETNAHWREFWQRWPHLKAVRSQALLTLNPDLISRPTLRVVEGIEQACRALDSVHD